MTRSGLIRWVFFDRDGTINDKPPSGEYVTSPGGLTLRPTAGDAIRRLNDRGVWVALVTNQRGISLGRMTVADFQAVQHELARKLADYSARLDAVYCCPHGIDACSCRKPQPGLLLQARQEHPSIDFARSAVVGDSLTDVEAGRRVGAFTVLLADHPDDHSDSGADFVAPTLDDAVSWIVSL